MKDGPSRKRHPPDKPVPRNLDICHVKPRMGSHRRDWMMSTGPYVVDGKGPQAGLGTASLTLYFAVTYTIQRLILQVKAQRIAAVPQNISEPNTRTSSW